MPEIVAVGGDFFAKERERQRVGLGFRVYMYMSIAKGYGELCERGNNRV
jgi:hypothetical protein